MLGCGAASSTPVRRGGVEFGTTHGPASSRAGTSLPLLERHPWLLPEPAASASRRPALPRCPARGAAPDGHHRAASTTPASSTTPAAWRWWRTSRAVPPMPWCAGRWPPSSTWPTGGRPVARRTAETGPGSSSRCRTSFYAGVVGFDLPPPGEYATGIMFLPRDAERAESARTALAKLAGEEGLTVLGWRDVPVDASRSARSVDGGHALDAPAVRGPGPGDASAGRGPGARPGPPGLRAPQAGRARDRRVLSGVAVGPHHRLQGDAHLTPTGRVLPRSVRRAGGQRVGARPLEVLHQHLPLVAAGPSLPVPGPQRRDQHPGRQPQLDAGPRGAVPRPTSSPGSSVPSPS